jgi:hypothetical protein
VVFVRRGITSHGVGRLHSSRFSKAASDLIASPHKYFASDNVYSWNLNWRVHMALKFSDLPGLFVQTMLHVVKGSREL